MTDNDDIDPIDAATEISKSERKRQMHALQELGERLVALPATELARIPIEDERLRDAVDTARRITARGGLKRQLQFIGKLMRSIDPTPIADGLAALEHRATEDAAAFHRIEHARDRLRAEGDQALGDILGIWPHAEISLLRQWIRQHPKEVSKGNERAHSRKLFRYLAELDQSDNEVS